MLDISIPAFTSSETSTICGNFVYTCTYGDGTSIDTSVYTFSTSPLKLSVQTNDNTKVGTRTFKITAY